MQLHTYHPMQSGLPTGSRIAWAELDDKFGDRLSGIGAWGDAAHRKRPSCHNTGSALDLMTGDPRTHLMIVLYALENRQRLMITRIISRGHVWSAKSNWMRGEYRGSSPHLDHGHLSINCDL